MKNRDNRLTVIREILTSQIISSQEALARQLAVNGFIVTQATLSRDLKKLKTIKVASDMGGYQYIIDESGSEKNESRKKQPSLHTAPIQSSLHPAATSISLSRNILVIKTRNGYAGGIAYDLDMLDSPLILGTISGADTVLVVLDESAPKSEIFSLLCDFLTPEVLDRGSHYFF